MNTVLTLLLLALGAAQCERVPLLAPSGSTITLTSATAVLPLNGSTRLVAQVLEAAGTPPQSGTRVSFSTTLGFVRPSEAETDISGRVEVVFAAGESSGTATITAFSGGAGAAAPPSGGNGGTTTTTTAANTVKIAIGAAAVGSVVISNASPNPVAATGGSSTITANVHDSNGNPLAGIPVTFATDNGTLNPAVATTDQNGNAQTVLTTSKVAKVTATAGVAAGGTTTPPAGQTATVTVNVNVVTTVSIGAPTPATPSVGQSVTFPLTYSSDANSAQVQSVTVDFGDGSKPVTLPGKAPSASHTYPAVGSYSVRATIVDSLGDTSTGSGSVTIGSLATVTIGTPTPANPIVGQAVNFPLTYGTAGGSPVQSLIVDFGDGSAAQKISGAPAGITHTYRSIGTFALQVIAFDAFGNSSTQTTSITISPLPAPTIGSPSPGSPFATQTVSFTITYATGSTSSVQRVEVDWGDGTKDSFNGAPSSVTHMYRASGTYGIRATIFDAFGNSSSGTTSIFVSARPVPAVTITPPTTVPQAGTDTTFTISVTPAANSGAIIQDVTIDFGEPGSGAVDLGPLTGTSSQHHTYQNPGTFTVVVTARDTNGAVGEARAIVFVQAAAALAVSIMPTLQSSNPTQHTATYQFTAQVTGLGNAVAQSYFWDFGDTQTQLTGSNQVTHSYATSTANTSFTVRVTVTTSDGRTTSNSTVITVQ